MKLLDKIFDKYSRWAPLPLRLAAGIIFTYHGSLKLFVNYIGTVRFFSFLNIPSPEVWVLFVGLIEFLGGLALLTGWWVRLSALLLLGDMLTAFVLAELPHGLTAIGTQYVFTLIFVLFSLIMSGGGQGSFGQSWHRWRWGA